MPEMKKRTLNSEIGTNNKSSVENDINTKQQWQKKQELKQFWRWKTKRLGLQKALVDRKQPQLPTNRRW